MQIPNNFTQLSVSEMGKVLFELDRSEMGDFFRRVGQHQWKPDSLARFYEATFMIMARNPGELQIQNLFREMIGSPYRPDLKGLSFDEKLRILGFAVGEDNQALFNEVMDAFFSEELDELTKQDEPKMRLFFLDYFAGKGLRDIRLCLLYARLKGDREVLIPFVRENPQVVEEFDCLDFLPPEEVKKLLQGHAEYVDLIDRGIGSEWALENCPFTLYCCGSTEWKERARMSNNAPALLIARVMKDEGLQGPFDLPYTSEDIQWAMRHNEQELIPPERRTPPRIHSHPFLHASPSIFGRLIDPSTLSDPYERFLVSFVNPEASLAPIDDRVLFESLERDNHWISLLRSGTADKVDALLKRFPTMAYALLSTVEDPFVAIQLVLWIRENRKEISEDLLKAKVVRAIKNGLRLQELLSNKAYLAYVREECPLVLWESVVNRPLVEGRVALFAELFESVPADKFKGLPKDDLKALCSLGLRTRNPKLFALAVQGSSLMAKNMYGEGEWMDFFKALHDLDPGTAWESLMLLGYERVSEENLKKLRSFVRQDSNNRATFAKEGLYQFLVISNSPLAPSFADPERPLLVFMPKLLEFPAESPERKLIQGLRDPTETEANIAIYASQVKDLVSLLSAPVRVPPYNRLVPIFDAETVSPAKLDVVFRGITENQFDAFEASHPVCASFIAAAAARYPRFQEVLVGLLQRFPSAENIKLAAERVPASLDGLSGKEFEKNVRASLSPHVIRWAMAHRPDLLSGFQGLTDPIERIECARLMIENQRFGNAEDLRNFEDKIKLEIEKTDPNKLCEALLGNKALMAFVLKRFPDVLSSQVGLFPAPGKERVLEELGNFEQRIRETNVARVARWATQNRPDLLSPSHLQYFPSSVEKFKFAALILKNQTVNEEQRSVLETEINLAIKKDVTGAQARELVRDEDLLLILGKNFLIPIWSLVVRRVASPVRESLLQKLAEVVPDGSLVVKMPSLLDYSPSSPERSLVRALFSGNESEENIALYASQISDLLPILSASVRLEPRDEPVSLLSIQGISSSALDRMLLTIPDDPNTSDVSFLAAATARQPRFQGTLLKALQTNMNPDNLRKAAAQKPDILNRLSGNEFEQCLKKADSPPVIRWMMVHRKDLLSPSHLTYLPNELDMLECARLIYETQSEFSTLLLNHMKKLIVYEIKKADSNNSLSPGLAENKALLHFLNENFPLQLWGGNRKMGDVELLGDRALMKLNGPLVEFIIRSGNFELLTDLMENNLQMKENGDLITVVCFSPLPLEARMAFFLQCNLKANTTLPVDILRELVTKEVHRTSLFNILVNYPGVTSQIIRAFPSQVVGAIDVNRLTVPGDLLNVSAQVYTEAITPEKIVEAAAQIDARKLLEQPFEILDDQGKSSTYTIEDLLGKLVAPTGDALADTQTIYALAQIPGEILAALAKAPNGYTYIEKLFPHFSPGAARVVIPLLSKDQQSGLLQSLSNLQVIGKFLSCMPSKDAIQHLRDFKAMWQPPVPRNAQEKTLFDTRIRALIEGVAKDSEAAKKVEELRPYFDALAAEAPVQSPPQVVMEYRVPIPDKFLCPLTLDIMSDPVKIKKEPENYDRSSLLRVKVSPFSRDLFTVLDLVPQPKLKEEIERWKEENKL